jgi:hypothetical protein
MRGHLGISLQTSGGKSVIEHGFRTFVTLFLALAMLVACEPEVAPETPPFGGQNPSSTPTPGSGGRGSDHAMANRGQQSDTVQKQDELQSALDFAKSELGRFEAALKERQALSNQKIATAQIKVDEQQKKISSYATKMSSGSLTPQESLELEQARRDKADAEKQLATEKEVKGINEKPIEALMQAKREEIAKIEADLQTLNGADSLTP